MNVSSFVGDLSSEKDDLSATRPGFTVSSATTHTYTLPSETSHAPTHTTIKSLRLHRPAHRDSPTRQGRCSLAGCTSGCSDPRRVHLSAMPHKGGEHTSRVLPSSAHRSHHPAGEGWSRHRHGEPSDALQALQRAEGQEHGRGWQVRPVNPRKHTHTPTRSSSWFAQGICITHRHPGTSPTPLPTLPHSPATSLAIPMPVVRSTLIHRPIHRKDDEFS
jgi:hypothetical protein